MNNLNKAFKLLIQSSLLCLIFSPTVVLAEYTPSVSISNVKATYTVNKDGTYTVISEKEFMIKTEDGVKTEGDRSISYKSTFENVTVLEAYTLQPDGKKIKVPKNAIRTTDDAISDGAPMFSDTKHKVIVFPDVKIGSRLYYKYKHVAHKVSFENHFYIGRFFSPHYQFGHYEVNVNISKQLPVYIDLKGVQGGLVRQSKTQNHYQFTFEQSNVHRPEKGMVQIEDFAPYLVLSTFKDQVEMGKHYQMTLAPKVKLTPQVQKLADTLTVGMTDPREQVKTLYYWVAKNIRYVSISVGNGGYVPHAVNTILSNRYGDCKDHAALLEALLKAKGIASSGALINAGDAYTIPKYAVGSPLNHIITYVPSLDLYLDSTSTYTTFGQLPEGVQNKPTILTALNTLGHTPAMHKENNSVSTVIHFSMLEDGSIDGASHVIPVGIEEGAYRQSRLNNMNRDERDVITNLLQFYGETGAGHITSTDPLDMLTPFEVRATFHLDAVANIPGPAAMTIPVGVAPGGIAAVSRDRPEDSHDYPFVCQPYQLSERYEIELPKSVRITRIPPDVSFNKDDIQYTATYRLDGHKVFVTRVLAVEHASEVCAPGTEDLTKEFFALLRRDLRSQIFYE